MRIAGAQWTAPSVSASGSIRRRGRRKIVYAARYPTGDYGSGRTMKAIVVTDRAAGTGGMTLTARPMPSPAINDVIVEVRASGFVPPELTWPSTWVDRQDRDRSPTIPGHELAGVVTALGYGTTGLTIGQRVFG